MVTKTDYSDICNLKYSDLKLCVDVIMDVIRRVTQGLIKNNNFPLWRGEILDIKKLFNYFKKVEWRMLTARYLNLLFALNYLGSQSDCNCMLKRANKLMRIFSKNRRRASGLPHNGQNLTRYVTMFPLFQRFAVFCSIHLCSKGEYWDKMNY